MTEIYQADVLPKLPATIRELSINLYDDGEVLFLSDADLEHVPELPVLHKLALSNLETLSIGALRSLAERLPALQELELRSTKGASNGLSELLEPFSG
ncbi:MAG TPA: hypothetical protein ENJ18_00015, partial [Nannocystis exedens]|nr:hypothetical protein [Nannocystis exedens]